MDEPVTDIPACPMAEGCELSVDISGECGLIYSSQREKPLAWNQRDWG